MSAATSSIGSHAVVVGGSMAGMMAARALAGYFSRVTVLERDEIARRPAPRRQTPQGNHYHALLVAGERVLEGLYPGFSKSLVDSGAVQWRPGLELVFYGPEGRAYNPTGTVLQGRDLGLKAYNQSRALIEHCLRQHVRQDPSISYRSPAAVRGILGDRGRVHGVECDVDGESIELLADLVVDAGGRRAQTPRWLESMGLAPPRETEIGVDFAYASAVFRLPDSLAIEEHTAVVAGPPPDFPNGGIAARIEDDHWIVSLGGRFGEYPPGDEEGFRRFAASLPHPILDQRLKNAERVSEIHRYRFPTSVQRHYERLDAFPDGLLCLGDAICSFNPAYGQGMSTAAQQVSALQELLEARAGAGRSLDGLAKEFFAKAAEVLMTPWMLAASQDLAFPKTKGERPPNAEQGARYFRALGELAAEDVEVHRLVIEVFNLVHPISKLMEMPLARRVAERLSADE
jgi:2-polyprenyl-6-methoxyphenol hydroxylase-like FAD-dependent oxidoreductase